MLSQMRMLYECGKDLLHGEGTVLGKSKVPLAALRHGALQRYALSTFDPHGGGDGGGAAMPGPTVRLALGTLAADELRLEAWDEDSATHVADDFLGQVTLSGAALFGALGTAETAGGRAHALCREAGRSAKFNRFVGGALRLRLDVGVDTAATAAAVAAGEEADEALSTRVVLVGRVESAAGLCRADAFSESDPYVRVLWNGELIHTCPTVQDSANPVWGSGNGGSFSATAQPRLLACGPADREAAAAASARRAGAAQAGFRREVGSGAGGGASAPEAGAAKAAAADEETALAAEGARLAEAEKRVAARRRKLLLAARAREIGQKRRAVAAFGGGGAVAAATAGDAEPDAALLAQAAKESGAAIEGEQWEAATGRHGGEVVVCTAPVVRMDGDGNSEAAERAAASSGSEQRDGAAHIAFGGATVGSAAEPDAPPGALTSANVRLHALVQRGTDWQWGDDDGGDGAVGEVLGWRALDGACGGRDPGADGMVGVCLVRWLASEIEQSYEMGVEACYALRLLPPTDAAGEKRARRASLAVAAQNDAAGVAPAVAAPPPAGASAPLQLMRVRGGVAQSSAATTPVVAAQPMRQRRGSLSKPRGAKIFRGASAAEVADAAPASTAAAPTKRRASVNGRRSSVAGADGVHVLGEPMRAWLRANRLDGGTRDAPPQQRTTFVERLLTFVCEPDDFVDLTEADVRHLMLLRATSCRHCRCRCATHRAPLLSRLTYQAPHPHRPCC
jgi:hypothetical protein